MIEETVKRFGGLDILVNNAGVNRDRTIRRMAAEEWREVIATDLDSVFYCTYAAVPHMIERGGGRIVNMSSIVGQMGNLGQSNYAAAKAGIVGFSKSAAQELARDRDEPQLPAPNRRRLYPNRLVTPLELDRLARLCDLRPGHHHSLLTTRQRACLAIPMPQPMSGQIGQK